jgi:hypothetical protein
MELYMNKESLSMIEKIFAVVLLAMLLPAAAFAAAGSGPALDERYFVAEIPPASAGGTVQVGVLLPRGAKIARTEVQVAATELGPDIEGWSDCDTDTKSCKLAETSIVRFHRNETETAQELVADMRNTGAESRFVKLTVIFQPQSGFDHTGCEDTKKCGFSRPIQNK